DAMVMAAQVLGHEAVAVYDGGAALKLLETYRPDLMILDLSMPGMDGYSLATAIRARPEFGATPLVALSGFGADADRQRALQSGFDLHTLKPMEIDTLEQLLLRVQRQPGRGVAREQPRPG